MNTVNGVIKHFLLINSSPDENMENLTKFCIKQSENYKTSLFLSTKSFTNMELMNSEKDVLNRLIIMHFDDVDKIISKLLELHIWTIKPNIIILDINGLFDDVAKNPKPGNKQICLLISSLLNYLKYLENLNDHLPISIVTVNSDIISNSLVKILVDLYFYNSSYSTVDSLINVLPNIL